MVTDGFVEAVCGVQESTVYSRIARGGSLGEIGMLLTNTWEINVRVGSDKVRCALIARSICVVFVKSGVLS